MKERPILFSGEMVRAILDGRKTQTRRIMRTQITHMHAMGEPGIIVYAGLGYPKRDGGYWLYPNATEEVLAQCPHGQVGDRLWVRETWREWGGTETRVDYRATSDIQRPADGWKPSIFMPRKYSRITLEITDVRIERLQDLSYEDALAEGVPDYRQIIDRHCNSESADDCARRLSWPQRSYANSWEKINGKDSWAVNPWVWVVEFQTNMSNAPVQRLAAGQSNATGS